MADTGLMRVIDLRQLELEAAARAAAELNATRKPDEAPVTVNDDGSVQVDGAKMWPYVDCGYLVTDAGFRVRVRWTGNGKTYLDVVVDDTASTENSKT